MNPVGSRTRARFAQGCWSKPRALGIECESPGLSGRSSVYSDPVPSGPGQLVDTASPRTQAQVARECWSTRGPSDSTASNARLLVEPAGFQTRTRGPQNYWSTPPGLGYSPQLPRTDGLPHGPSDTGPSRPGRLVDNTVRLTRVGVTRDNWSTTGTRTRTGVFWDSWSIPRAFRHGPESRRTADQPHWLSEPGTSCPGVLVDTAGPRN